ncbi:MAG TPA: glycine cleavage system protein GcvH [Hyphomicrobiaceae bacterium]|nr:glycine cleavage system protein GcvH [Hyphomicrobiaceae bacterium]
MAKDYFTKDHEWIRVEGDVGTVGITAYATGQLGDVVFVEVPEVGRKVKAHEACAVVESVKAASDIYAPVSGEVVDVNGELTTTPAMVNESPEARAWFYKLKIADPKELAGLMDKATYDAHCETGA